MIHVLLAEMPAAAPCLLFDRFLSTSCINFLFNKLREDFVDDLLVKLNFLGHSFNEFRVKLIVGIAEFGQRNVLTE